MTYKNCTGKRKYPSVPIIHLTSGKFSPVICLWEINKCTPSRRQRLMLQKDMDRRCSYIILYSKHEINEAYAVWKINHCVIKENEMLLSRLWGKVSHSIPHTPFKKTSIALSLSVTMHLVHCKSCNTLLIIAAPYTMVMPTTQLQSMTIDDLKTRKSFPCYWPFAREIHQSAVVSLRVLPVLQTIVDFCLK